MAETKKLHIAMFPWLAFGHIIPYLELAKLMAQKGHRISFISTPGNIQRLPKLPPNLVSRIEFVNISLPYEPNLPENAEATTDVPYNKIPFLKKASDGLQQPLTEFLETSSPDWIIHDLFPFWLPPIAENLGISRALFTIFNAWTLCFVGSSVPEITGIIDTRTTPEEFTVPPKWVPFPSNVAFRLHEARKVFDAVEQNDSGIPDVSRFMSTIKGSDVIIFRSCNELEKEWLDLFQHVQQKPVIPILLPPSIQIGSDKRDEISSTVEEWLNQQKPESVIYIALGTEVTPSQNDFTELALGIENSGVPFFWALRKKNGIEDGSQVMLPEGFEERTKDRGVVWTSWAPQLKILSHNSVGGFLTHCGWSSVIEGVHFGCALVMLPFVTDQGLNARVMVEKNVGIEIERNEEDGSFTRDSVTESIRSVMVGEKSVCKEEAKKLSKIFCDQELHNQYVDKLVEYLQK